ncbi:MAG: preprotein translocase subunit YajC [Peptostreptococcaceae bacterium]|nr:preprotein translocase subunit YajC [Peptostreptococcaceae bacterium]
MTGLTSLIPLVILLGVMYFLMIRPQNKRDKETKAMRNSVEVGDEIVTIGGICGKIVKTKETTVIVQVGADKVKFELLRTAVGSVTKKTDKPKSYKETIEDEDEPKKVVPKKLGRGKKKAEDIKEEALENAVAEKEHEEEEN